MEHKTFNQSTASEL